MVCWRAKFPRCVRSGPLRLLGLGFHHASELGQPLERVQQRLAPRSVSQTVEPHASLAAALHETALAEDSQRVRRGVLGDIERERDVTDAQLLDRQQRREDASANRLTDDAEQGVQLGRLIAAESLRPHLGDAIRIHRVRVISHRPTSTRLRLSVRRHG